MSRFIELHVRKEDSLPLPTWRFQNELSRIEDVFDEGVSVCIPPDSTSELLDGVRPFRLKKNQIATPASSEPGFGIARSFGRPPYGKQDRACSIVAISWRHTPTVKYVHLRDVLDDMENIQRGCGRGVSSLLQWLRGQFKNKTSGYYQRGCETLSSGSIVLDTNRTKQTVFSFTRFSAAVPIIIEDKVCYNVEFQWEEQQWSTVP